jgi:N-acetylmuramoyl-L-alanine amidase
LIRKLLLSSVMLAICCGTAAAQDSDRAVEFHFGDRAIVVPRFGPKIELLPVLELVGAEARYSLSAGTWGVVLGDSVIQFSVGHKVMLVNGNLQDANEAPVASPGGVAASLSFLERSLLSPLGFRLDPIPRGYRIEPGARFADPVNIRPAVADFGVTTTLVLTLSRSAPADVADAEPGRVSVHFNQSTPHLESDSPFRSRRVLSLTSREQTVEIGLAPEIGLLSWHTLEGPPRITMEFGPARAKPTPAPNHVPVVIPTGPRPIVIDPGHGGDDIGAHSGSGLMEKDVTLAVARRLARVLEARGYRVRLTRDGDQNRALTDRTSLANRLDAVAFVSLHANAFTASSVSGAETYYMSIDEASDADAAAVADLENRAGTSSGERTPLDLILWDLAQAEVLNESARLALSVQLSLNSQLGARDRGVRQAPFVVLTGATMPAILVEVGFLSNSTEADRLAQPEHQQKLAEAIAAGIEDFVRR